MVPLGIIQVPLNRFPHARLKGLFRTPAQLGAYPGAVDGIAPVVSWAVLYECNQAAMRDMLGRGNHLIQKSAQYIYDFKVRFFAASAVIVCLPGPTLFEYCMQRLAVVIDVEPVTHVEPVTVYRQRLSFDRIEDYERRKLFRKLPRTVIVRTIRNECGDPKGMKICPHQVIACSLAG